MRVLLADVDAVIEPHQLERAVEPHVSEYLVVAELFHPECNPGEMGAKRIWEPGKLGRSDGGDLFE